MTTREIITTLEMLFLLTTVTLACVLLLPSLADTMKVLAHASLMGRHINMVKSSTTQQMVLETASQPNVERMGK